MRARANTVAAFVLIALSASRTEAQAPSRDGTQGHQAISVEDVIVGQRVRIQSSAFGVGRTSLVHLPDRYEDSDDRYPVLVVAGDECFLPATGVATYLAGDGRIPEVILVAVPIEDWPASSLTPRPGTRLPSMPQPAAQIGCGGSSLTK